MKRWAVTICAALVVCALAWLGGFDFNERGAGAFLLAIWALLAAAFAYTYPGWSE